jgi:hypothetical protein
MLRTGVVAGVLAFVGMGAAQAQPAACAQIKQLMASTNAQVKAQQGAQKSTTAEDIVYVSKLQLAGFSNCTLESGKAKAKLSGYFEHHLGCEGSAADSETATQLVEGLWACTKDGFSERHDQEAWMGGKYRVIGFEGEQPSAGRAAGLVDFGTTDFSRIVLEKSYEDSEDFDVHIYWYFSK